MENENGKLPFEVTQKAYREAYEALVIPQLNNPESTIARSLRADEEVILSGYKDTGFSPVENYAVKLPRNHFLPLALPLNCEVVKSEGLGHNLLQIYLYGEDENIASIARRTNISRQSLNQNVKYEFKKLLNYVPEVGEKYAFEALSFFKSSKSFLNWLKDQVDSGRSYDDLVSSGISPFSLKAARDKFNHRQRKSPPTMRIFY